MLTHAVELTPKKREDKSKIFGSLDKSAKYTITQEIKSILQSKGVIAFAKGKGKDRSFFWFSWRVYTKKSPIIALKNHNKLS